jgi:hypothetical protein
MDAILERTSSAVLCGGLNCKHPTRYSRVANSNVHILEVDADEARAVCTRSTAANTKNYLTTTGTMGPTGYCHT